MTIRFLRSSSRKYFGKINRQKKKYKTLGNSKGMTKGMIRE